MCKIKAAEARVGQKMEPLNGREKTEFAENKVRGASSGEGWRAAQLSAEEMCSGTHRRQIWFVSCTD